MKRLIYLLPLLVTLAGCFNNNNQPVPEPSGSYTGEFRRVSREKNATTIDTVKTNLTVVIEPGVGYHVLGDTTTVHAGSKGHYGINSSSMLFMDSTYPKTGVPVKNHLNGEYLYIYDGKILQMVRNSGDTLSLQYDLKKAN
ncbi:MULTISPECIES: hypothetical protein [unclassified Mucilaginibacter]|uniref:hypothetical protein n=1 Tax=unclassified Mucilaginibacter TaxID=2617802 RepID=UPI00138C54F5|nr:MULTISPECIES: hypothetical protein [unclassified Mucilaginibacter]MBB5395542.1 hypothetical protein [Mucilaginibacter sp. AK015]QHS56156.1 hypothetical protein GWR56_11635 [Mucilaginibacter sp. 14171R-50]